LQASVSSVEIPPEPVAMAGSLGAPVMCGRPPTPTQMQLQHRRLRQQQQQQNQHQQHTRSQQIVPLNLHGVGNQQQQHIAATRQCQQATTPMSYVAGRTPWSSQTFASAPAAPPAQTTRSMGRLTVLEQGVKAIASHLQATGHNQGLGRFVEPVGSNSRALSARQTRSTPWLQLPNQAQPVSARATFGNRSMCTEIPRSCSAAVIPPVASRSFSPPALGCRRGGVTTVAALGGPHIRCGCCTSSEPEPESPVKKKKKQALPHYCCFEQAHS